MNVETKITIEHQVVRCPICDSERVTCNAKRTRQGGAMRYYLCRCGAKFRTWQKVQEKEKIRAPDKED